MPEKNYNIKKGWFDRVDMFLSDLSGLFYVLEWNIRLIKI